MAEKGSNKQVWLLLFIIIVVAITAGAIGYYLDGAKERAPEVAAASVEPEAAATSIPASAKTSLSQQGNTAEVTREEAPSFFYGEDCPPEENPQGCSFDVGVNPHQISLAFGWHIKWPKGGLDAGGNGCDLVLLNPGWYENLWFEDGRFEIYDVPERDREGWIEVLAVQRAEEQMLNYNCIGKDLSDIPVWDSSRPSPPVSAVTSAETTEQAAPAPTSERRATGQNKTLRFAKGEAVYGWRIELDTDEVCDGGECYLPVAPGPGEVTSGVINPWPAEVQGLNSWNPN